jgi:hypothetical protein
MKFGRTEAVFAIERRNRNLIVLKAWGDLRDKHVPSTHVAIAGLQLRHRHPLRHRHRSKFRHGRHRDERHLLIRAQAGRIWIDDGELA